MIVLSTIKLYILCKTSPYSSLNTLVSRYQIFFFYFSYLTRRIYIKFLILFQKRINNFEIRFINTINRKQILRKLYKRQKIKMLLCQRLFFVCDKVGYFSQEIDYNFLTFFHSTHSYKNVR